MNTILIYFALKYKGDFDAIYKALKSNETVPYESAKQIEKSLDNKSLRAITILDENYPEGFKFLNKPPFVIFYRGNIKLLNNKNIISLTGQHKTSEVMHFLSNSLPEIIKTQTLVTGYFPWLDKDIVNYFQTHKKPAIYVSCNGIEKPYFGTEVVEDQNSLVISEYPAGTNISKKRLRDRNRIISAIAYSLVIYSSKKKSGIMNLVTHFLDQGKEIYCFPGELNEDDGNNELISQGANMITSVLDLS